MPNTRNDEQPLVVSRHKIARLIDCSLRHVDYLTERGVLEKVSLGPRKVGIIIGREAGREGQVSNGLPRCDESRPSVR